MTAMLCVGVLAGCSSSGGEASSDDGSKKGQSKSISIGLDPYNYSKPPAYISKEILENEGYDVEIKEADVGILFSALANGDLDSYIDIWSPNLQAQYLKKYKGDFKVVGTLYKDTPIGIAVPKYMKNVNSIEDLKKYKDQFDGKIYGIEPETGMDKTTHKMIDAYDMDYEVENSSDQGMIAQVERMMKRKKPIAFQGWHPHTMFQKLDIKMLDDPKNVWKFDNVQIGVANDLQEEMPGAYTLFSNMKLTVDEIERWMVEMKDNDKDPEDLAKEFVKDHKKKINKWLER